MLGVKITKEFQQFNIYLNLIIISMSILIHSGLENYLTKKKILHIMGIHN